FGQPVLGVGALDREGGHAGLEPADLVGCLLGVVDGRRARGGDDEAESGQRGAVEGREEAVAEAAAGDREPDLALEAGGGAESLLSAGAPGRRCPGTTGRLHRGKY